MSEINVKEQIKLLVILQKIDTEIYDIKRALIEKPEQLEELKQNFESKKQHLKELEEKLKRIQVKRKDFELDLKAKEDALAKSNAQLSQIKTNKEYTAKLSEIENIKADMSIIEERILISYDEADVVQDDINKEKERVGEEEKLYNLEKQTVEREVNDMKARLKELEANRQKNVGAVHPEYLARYDKILVHKEGLAIVPLTKYLACGGCYVKPTHQDINEIKMHSDLFICERCSRILYIEEDL